MKIYISSFNKINTFTENCIPISTAGGSGWPYWLYKYYNQPKGSFFLSKNNIMLGITEEKFTEFDFFDSLEEKCGEKPCPFMSKAPNCEFMNKYLSCIETIDIDYLLNEFERVSEDVRKVTNYVGEPNIILMVYEPSTCICAERPCLIKYFKNHGIEVKEWEKPEDEIF